MWPLTERGGEREREVVRTGEPNHEEWLSEWTVLCVIEQNRFNREKQKINLYHSCIEIVGTL